MSDTPHINKWFEGFFKPAPEFNEADIKRWISQKCIGYQVNGDLQREPSLPGKLSWKMARSKRCGFCSTHTGRA